MPLPMPALRLSRGWVAKVQHAVHQAPWAGTITLSQSSLRRTSLSAAHSGVQSKGSMMRRLALGVAGVIALVATPAFARDGAVYVGAELGAMKANDTDIDVGTVPGAVALNYRFDLPQHAGWDAAGFIGYDFGGFRLEAEYS